MGAGMTGWSMALVRWWTAAYTSGLPPAIRDGRRAEVESDLWESTHDPSGDPQLFPRFLLGIIDDLRWRAGLLDVHSRDMLGRVTFGALACFSLWQIALTLHLGPKLLESTWAYPLVESLHVLGLAVFLGLTLMLDLRLMGASLRWLPVSELVETVLPWTTGGALVAIGTGMLAFLADPGRYLANPLFLLKMAAMAVALVNSFAFHLVLYRHVREWEQMAVPPRAVRVAACVSVALWSFVVVSGRLVAYAWF
jgi:hypothetical protein